MYPSQHLILGIIFSIVLFLLFPGIGAIGVSIIILSSVLIDIDHYLLYVYRKKNFSLKSSYEWFNQGNDKFFAMTRQQRNEIYCGPFFLHGIEMLLALFLLGIFLSKFFLFILVGFAFHLLLDLLYESRYKDRVDKLSLINDFKKSKQLKFFEDA